ncbi:MAG: type II toxin-antitoxin system VapC family toxin [Chlorogloeopsis fritschii C42_A2020_084]|uniref:type II toxin-antitoxin system VapC family toxin n=1 Tax=Chlorogloeopsis fritschii TaxID=1124 RepID=UPI0019FB9368|nr:type II toxin-antitoxin system VapC family toxin [Chlorogloeopsis fritschii]MBF2008587.1 type II toxin-antitoxin system VapC family toxin [Chlorogloeopsis fritschii C42_A2020_084]
MKIVPDSNIVLALVLTLPYTPASINKMREWQEQNTELLVPTLWSYEVTSSLRKAIASRSISDEIATRALQHILSLEICEVPPTPTLHLKALEWAAKLNQIVAYDAAYLALAESEGAEFWTADRRLAEAARNLGAYWVHFIDE